MTKIWFFIYNFVVLPLFYLLLMLLGLFNKKIKEGIRDRKKLFENLIINLAGINRKKKMIWFHSSSMGEFEQAKPIIQEIRKRKDVMIIVTFFSPSGYRNSLKYPHADIVSYIPFDTPNYAIRFLRLVKPTLAVFMRYDIWPNFVWRLSKLKIPTFIVDATMRDSSKRKLPGIKGFHKKMYSSITKILTVSENDLSSFKDFEINSDQLLAVGDTRFDRVYQKSIQAKERKLFKDNFFGEKKVFVMGSSWEADEDVVLPAFLKLMENDENVILIIVPHEPTVVHLEKIENELYGKAKSIRFSFLNNYADERIIIIDSIGILLTLYYYADAAYVGGSFKQGIHNVLEPAVYGIPVLFGPKIENSQEAKKLVELGGGKVIKNKKEAYRVLRTLFSNDEQRLKMGNISKEYVNSNIGATEKIIKELEKFL
ncbi:MAG: 3-deoxy-D-manno-octulosonic acid transferase [Ignavibacteriae bacterium]|nr:3-deoxy-D-manno-octulosonic acid transferase [Ignavibacteriota bacterium]